MAAENSNSGLLDSLITNAKREVHFLIDLLNPLPIGDSFENVMDAGKFVRSNNVGSLAETLALGGVNGPAYDQIVNQAKQSVQKAGGTAKQVDAAGRVVASYLDRFNQAGSLNLSDLNFSLGDPSSRVPLYLLLGAVGILAVIFFMPGRRR